MTTHPDISRSSANSAILTRYRTILFQLQFSAVSDMPLDQAAMALALQERQLAHDVQELLLSFVENDNNEFESRMLEWCLVEHSKLCAEWIERFQKKPFKSSIKTWLPVVLNLYVRLNRLAILSRLFRKQYGYNLFFSNFNYALSIAHKFDVVAELTEKPYGDGDETVLGSFIFITLLYSAWPFSLKQSDLWAFAQWLWKHVRHVEIVTKAPTKLNATWIIDFNQTEAPKRALFDSDVKNSYGCWFMNANPLIEYLSELPNEHLQEQIHMRLFSNSKNMPTCVKASISIEIAEFDFLKIHDWLAEPHLHESPVFSVCETVDVGEREVHIVTTKTYTQFSINQLFIVRYPKNNSISLVVVRKIEQVMNNNTLLYMELLGKYLQPIQIRSEWADVANSNRPENWVNAVLLKPIGDNDSINLLLPHINVISGEHVHCQSIDKKTFCGELIFNRLLELYPQCQLVNARKAELFFD